MTDEYFPWLTDRLYRDFPIAQAMGIQVESVSETGVIVSGKFGENINPKSSVFAGSIYSVAVISCWASLTYELEGNGFVPDYVIMQNGTIDYVAPVLSDFRAVASWESGESKERFLRVLRRKCLARVPLNSIIQTHGKDCALLGARFVAQVIKPSLNFS